MGRGYLPKQISKQIVAYVADGGEKLRWKTGRVATQTFYPFLGQSPIAVLPGIIDLDLRLFGIFPLKRITLEVVPPVKVVVGGHSIGVLVHAQGVVVVGYADIHSPENGSGEVCPAREVGILPGDVIVRIEGRNVQSDSQVSFLIDSLARQKDELRIQVKRGDKYKEFKVRPVYCSETKRYRIGLYIRDGAAGIGTLTFYDPVTKIYGALGHMICDSKTNKSLDLHDGRIVEASVQG
ncbi:MAG: SpoIVB peptidase S55 domain-containing protein, partial [Thermacetogeniaceae bacterium]